MKMQIKLNNTRILKSWWSRSSLSTCKVGITAKGPLHIIKEKGKKIYMLNRNNLVCHALNENAVSCVLLISFKMFVTYSFKTFTNKCSYFIFPPMSILNQFELLFYSHTRTPKISFHITKINVGIIVETPFQLSY